MGAHVLRLHACRRRGLQGAAVGLVGSVLLMADARAQTTACGRQEGERCRRGGDCCSGRCQRKKGKKKGRCACGNLQKTCFDTFDCRARRNGANDLAVCSDKNGFANIVCRVAFSGSCQSDAACCSELVYEGEVCTAE